MGIWDYTPWGKNSAPSNTTSGYANSSSSSSQLSSGGSANNVQVVAKGPNHYLFLADAPGKKIIQNLRTSLLLRRLASLLKSVPKRIPLKIIKKLYGRLFGVQLQVVS